MSNEELKSHIKELQQQMEDSQVSAEDRNLLGNLMSDIVQLAGGDHTDDEVDESIQEKLERHASNFEQQHPTLAGVMRQIADALGKMGI